jgi:hypothetical protein
VARSHEAKEQLGLFGMPGEEQAWSYTRLKSLRRCPLEYKVRWLDGEQSLFQPGYVDVQAGRLLHRIVREYYRCPPTTDRHRLLLDTYHKLAPTDPAWKNDLQGENRVLQALRLFAYSKAASFRPLALEVACKTRIKELLFVGQADLIYQIPELPGMSGILEFKLNDAEVRSEDLGERFLQGLIYYGGLPTQFRVSTRFVSLYIFDIGSLLETKVDQQLLDRATRIVEAALHSAKGPEFPPRINSFCKSCGYQRLCPAYSTFQR